MEQMLNSDIAQIRLINQRLIANKFKTAHEAVSYFAAVQSQDYFAAKWSLAQRVKEINDAKIDEDFNKGEILRTHVMRPTWHFVSPNDIRWLLALTSPQVKKQMDNYNRKLELDDALFSKSAALISKILHDKKYATRQEIKTEFTNAGIKTDVQRLAHIVMRAELDGIICSGPRLGKQFTYALLEERVPKTKTLSHDEALATLTNRYFTSHGPAQLKDFVWWSGLTIKDAQEGISMIKSKLTEANIDGKNYWFTPQKTIIDKKPRAFLLSLFDEYIIAYKDRSALGKERYFEKFIARGNSLTSVIIFDGEIVGTWKRIIKKAAVEIKLNPFKTLNEIEKDALKKEANNYSKFINLPIIT